jgi:hypothetical protein
LRAEMSVQWPRKLEINGRLPLSNAGFVAACPLSHSKKKESATTRLIRPIKEP